MKLEQSFEVAAPVERVWQALIDVEHVAPCLPGATVTGRNEDGSYNGTFTIKIGPTTASYSGKLVMEQIDEGARTATMQAQGADKRGQGGAKATIVSKLSDLDAGGTRVEVDTDYHITGRLARFGRGGMIEDISQRLLGQFAERLQASLGAQRGESSAGEGVSDPDRVATQILEPSDVPKSGPVGAPELPQSSVQPPPEQGQPLKAAEPIHGVSLVRGVLWDRLRGNPAPVAFLFGLLLALVLFRRRRG